MNSSIKCIQICQNVEKNNKKKISQGQGFVCLFIRFFVLSIYFGNDYNKLVLAKRIDTTVNVGAGVKVSFRKVGTVCLSS